MDGMGYSRDASPVSVGEELDVEIEAVGEKGDGIAKRSGFVLFVPNTRKGDQVRIRVTRVLQKVGFAEVVGSASSESESNNAPSAEESDDEPRDEAQRDAESQSAEPEEPPKDSYDFGEEEKQ